MSEATLSLQEVVGGGYAEFWNTKKTYVVCKGSRASKKSKTTALWHIHNIMKYPLANALVVRKTERTLRNSCFADLLWAIDRLGVNKYWKSTVNPLELTYIPTGQKILFRGLDDSFKITSIAVSYGVLNFLWIEEAYEINKEDDFDRLDESIRGLLPEGYFKRVTVTLNPWSDKHWIKKRFFDTESDNILAMTTTYKVNEWLSETDLRLFEDMKKRNPRRYQVAGEGHWGIVDGLVYENWKEEAFKFITKAELMQRTGAEMLQCRGSGADVPESYIVSDGLESVFGMDFGYTNDPTALFCGMLDKNNKKLYVFDELYKKGLSNKRIYEEVVEMGYKKERITADSAEPKSIDELKGYGLRVKPAVKGRDSINNGIQWIQDLEIIIHPRCVNFLTEISNYIWAEDKFGNKLNKPIDDFNHLMDAMRYALEKYIKNKSWLY